MTTMKVSTLFSFLVGRRQAILEIAGDPKAVWIGMLLVLSAALAREYDAEYLPAKPWLLALPWAMSLVVSFLIFAIFRLAARKRVPRPAFWPSYRSFLALFWMTAPLAWLYAVPYERFLTPYDATVANLWTLAVVAAWRVVLIMGAASVLFGFGPIRSLFLVMLPADAIAVAVAILSPKPIIAIMGGVSHSPEDALLSSITFNVILLGICSFPVWLVGAVVAVLFAQVRGAAWATITPGRATRAAWGLAWGSVAVWILVLPFTQAEQRLASRADRLLESGRIPEALDFLSDHPRERFPPHFDPRPRLWEGETTPDLLDVMETLADRPPAPWVSETYVRKLVQRRDERRWGGDYQSRLALLLPRLQDGARIAASLGYGDPEVRAEPDEAFLILRELARSAGDGVPRTVGRVERLDAALDRLVPADAVLEVLADGLDWPEGPVWINDGGFLLFSDVPRNVIYRWRESDGLSVWLEPSGYTGERERGGEPGSNGLLLDGSGRLVLCQHGDRRVARLDASWTDPKPEFVTLADAHEGKRLNSPNDAVFHSNGDLYFTDPPYGLEGGPESPDRELDFQGVYRATADGEVVLLTADLTRPNGIALSPDERILYVANSDPERAVWMAYELGPGGALGPGRVFFDATPWVPERPGLPDGMAVDRDGNLFATGPGGVLVFSPEGKHLGTLDTTRPTANCTFGGDGSELYITADDYLLRIRLTTRGLGY